MGETDYATNQMDPRPKHFIALAFTAFLYRKVEGFKNPSHKNFHVWPPETPRLKKVKVDPT